MKFEIAGEHGVEGNFAVRRRTNLRYRLIFDVKPLARFATLPLILESLFAR